MIIFHKKIKHSDPKRNLKIYKKKIKEGAILSSRETFYFAREYYTIIREFPSGKGFADLCFIPRKMHADKPAAVIELKWDKSAEGAIAQIKERQYVSDLKAYHGDLLLAGINYDKKEKKHTCLIEKYRV